MSSEELKELLDEWLEEFFVDASGNQLEKALGNWKRLSKKKNVNKEEVRIFENKFLNKRVMTVNDEIKGFFADQNYVFHISNKSKNGLFWIFISDLQYFKSTGNQSDWSLESLVIYPSSIGEETEGCFSTKENPTKVKQELLDMGFIEDIEYSHLISSLH